MNLRSGSCLQHNRYRIESVLRQGGFGITYRAIQLGLDRPVAIKEFFMKEYCNRDKQNSHVSVGTEGSRELVERFRQKFIKEAKTIASLRHPHIVSIHDVFEENGTAYYVMEYYEGGSLSDLLKQRGAFAEHEALDYIRQVASALSYIHERSINHLDVKPGNVLLNATGRAVLIDFGLSKHYDSMGQETSTTPGGISEGYAPPEQYRKGGVGKFTPSTDVYSLGATLYKLLSNETPPAAFDVADDGLPPLPATVSKATATAIEQAMQPARKMRPQTVADFLAMLPGDEVPIAPVAPATPIDKEASQTVLSAENRRKQEAAKAEAIARKPNNCPVPWWKRPMVWGAAVVALVLLAVLLFGGKGSEMPEPEPTPMPTPVADTLLQEANDSLNDEKQVADTTKTTVQDVAQVATHTMLNVTTTPKGATVKIDGKSVGTTPIKEYEVARGRHRVTINLNGYEEISKTIDFGEKQVKLNEVLKEEANQVAPATTIINGHEAVDLGLSVKWATCNVGASRPEKYGSYFAWGETTPKSMYDWDTYKWCNGSYNSLTKYCTGNKYGTVDNKKQIEMSDDAARVNWGIPWRMPTEEEWKELLKECIWTWTTHNGVQGYKVVCKKNGNSIFLPAAGYSNGGSLSYAGSGGYYWSSWLYNTSTPDLARSICFPNYVDWSNNCRCNGLSVRPVCE